MKLIFGKFVLKQAEELGRAIADAKQRGIHTIIVPYWQETPVQLVDLSRCTPPRRWVSLHAHRGRL